MQSNNNKEQIPIKYKEKNELDTKYFDELFKKIKSEDPNNLDGNESIEILYENVIDQMGNSLTELKKCSLSFHVDYFIYKSNFKSFVKIFEIITKSDEQIAELLNDVRSSRIIEICLLCLGLKLHELKAQQVKKSTDKNQEDQDALKSCLDRLASYLVDNFSDIIENQNGIFTLRTFLRVIGEQDPLESTKNEIDTKPKFNKNNKNKEFDVRDLVPKLLPEEWRHEKTLKKMSAKLDDLNVLELGLNPTISPCISLLLRKFSLSNEKKCKKIATVIHEQLTKKSNSFSSMIQDSVGSRFIESFLFVCPTDILVDHYLNELILPNLVNYSKHIYANYPIQTLIKHRLPKNEELKILFDELLKNLDSIIDLHSDLIFKNYLLIELIDCTQKNSAYDLKAVVEALMELLGCKDEENRIHFFKILLVYEKLSDILEETTVDMLLFTFNPKPIASIIVGKLVEYDDKYTTKSFNNLNSNELEFLCTNNVGSHVIQKCLNVFGKKDRNVWLQSIFDKLKGRFQILCTNSSGSFVVESLWQIATLKQRSAIAEELKPNEVQLKNDRYARFFVNKIGLNYFKRKPEDWKEAQSSEIKKQKMIHSLIKEAQ